MKISKSNTKIPVAKISLFHNYLTLQSLQNSRFEKLANNGLSSCMPVVAVNSRKGGHFRVLGARTGNERLAGPVRFSYPKFISTLPLSIVLVYDKAHIPGGF